MADFGLTPPAPNTGDPSSTFWQMAILTTANKLGVAPTDLASAIVSNPEAAAARLDSIGAPTPAEAAVASSTDHLGSSLAPQEPMTLQHPLELEPGAVSDPTQPYYQAPPAGALPPAAQAPPPVAVAPVAPHSGGIGSAFAASGGGAVAIPPPSAPALTGAGLASAGAAGVATQAPASNLTDLLAGIQPPDQPTAPQIATPGAPPGPHPIQTGNLEQLLMQVLGPTGKFNPTNLALSQALGRRASV